MLTKLNKRAAFEYQYHIESVLEEKEGVFKNANYDVGRAVKTGLWATVRGMTELGTAAGEGSDFMADTFQKVVFLFGMDKLYEGDAGETPLEEEAAPSGSN
jgi:hypothetical protein